MPPAKAGGFFRLCAGAHSHCAPIPLRFAPTVPYSANGTVAFVYDCPTDWRPSTTVYSRFNRWSAQSLWLNLLDAWVDAGAVTRSTAVDSTYIKAVTVRR